MAEVSPSLFDALEPDVRSDAQPEDAPLPPLSGTVFEGSREPIEEHPLLKAPEGGESFMELLDQEGIGAKTVSDMGALGSGTARGALVGGGATAGALSGMALGAMVPPPAQVATVPAGGLLGLLGGVMAGDTAAGALEDAGVIASFEDLTAAQRPLYLTGEAFGGGISGVGMSMTFAKTGIRFGSTFAGRMANSVLNYARRHPFKYGLWETSAVVSSAGAEGLFEVVRPGHPLERMGVGITAGVLNPVNLSLKTSQGIIQLTRRMFASVNPAARRSAAAQELERLLVGLGGDPDTMLQELADGRRLSELIPNFKPSAATATGSPMVARIEQNLARMDETFLGNRAVDIQRSQEALVNAIGLLEAVGDPEALRIALNLRKLRYDNTMERLIAYAEIEARQAAQQIAGRDAPADAASRVAQQADISSEVSRIFERNLELAREVEREIWETTLGGADQLGTFARTNRMLSRLQGETTELIPMPDEVTRQMQIFADAQDLITRYDTSGVLADGTEITAAMVRAARAEISVGKMLNFRRDLLRLARGQARSTDPKADSLGRIYGLMAEGVLDDLVALGAATKPGQISPPGANYGLSAEGLRDVRRASGGRFVAEPTALDEARAYTQALNDAYTRSFGGMAAQETAYGHRIPPEVLMRRTMASGQEAALQKVNELEEAMGFLPDIVRATSPERAALMQQNAELFMDFQARYLRLLADETRDFATGQVSISRMQSFMQRHSALLDKFPDIKSSLETAMSTQERFAEWTRRVTGIQRDMQRSTFGRLLNTDSPADFIRGAINSDQPITQLDEALNLAKIGGVDAQMGFKRSLWEVIFHRSGAHRGTMNLGMLNKAFNDPIRPGLPSMRQYLVSRDLISSDNLRFLDDALMMERNLQQTMSAQGISEEIVETQNALINLMVRMVGSELASMGLSAFQTLTGAGRNMASSLIVRTRGSAALVHFTDRIPRMKIQDLLVDAFAGEPLEVGGRPFSLLEEILRPATTAQAQARIVARLHAYAWQAAILGAEDERDLGLPTINEYSNFIGEQMNRDAEMLSGGSETSLFDALEGPGSREPNLDDVSTPGTGPRVDERDVEQQSLMDALEEQGGFQAGQFSDPREGPRGEGVPGLDGEELALVAADLRRDEGFRSQPYQDSRGVWTIGYGENLEARAKVTARDVRDMQLTQEEANSLMLDRVAETTATLKRRVRNWDSLGLNQRRALINMAYQMGVTKLMEFRNMMTAVRRGDFDVAARHALDSDWAKQTPARAARVAAMLSTEE